VTAGPARWRFVVEAHPDCDALIRVLTPFAVQGAELTEVVLAQAAGGLSISVEAAGLDRVRAETLLRRLEGLPVVRRIGLGWRSREAAA
jgi:hypothetical protein